MQQNDTVVSLFQGQNKKATLLKLKLAGLLSTDPFLPFAAEVSCPQLLVSLDMQSRDCSGCGIDGGSNHSGLDSAGQAAPGFSGAGAS